MSDGPPRLFDRSTVLRHRARAARMDGEPFLLREAAQGLAARLAAVNRRFSRGLEIEGRPAAFAWLGPHAECWTKAELGRDEILAVEPASFDVAVSVLTLHAVNDLPGVLAQIRRALQPDGLFMAALFGGATLFELRASIAAAEIEATGGASPRVAPLADVRELGGLLQRAGFALPVADVERTTVLYRDVMSLLRDLRLHGETSALAERGKPLTRPTLAALLDHYATHHAQSDGRLRATFDIVYLTGWAPHDSQQRPLKPGSAKKRLAEALGTDERSAGETARPD